MWLLIYYNNLNCIICMYAYVSSLHAPQIFSQQHRTLWTLFKTPPLTKWQGEYFNFDVAIVRSKKWKWWAASLKHLPNQPGWRETSFNQAAKAVETSPVICHGLRWHSSLWFPQSQRDSGHQELKTDLAFIQRADGSHGREESQSHLCLRRSFPKQHGGHTREVNAAEKETVGMPLAFSLFSEPFSHGRSSEHRRAGEHDSRGGGSVVTLLFEEAIYLLETLS